MRTCSGAMTLLAVLIVLCGTGFASADDYTFQLIADNTGDFSALAGSAWMSDSGAVLFNGLLTGVSGWGVYTSDGVNTVEIVHTSSSPYSDVGAGAIAPDGTVSFWARDADAMYICKGDGVNTTVIADTTGPFTGFQGGAINSNGWVAFAADGDDSGYLGVYRGDGDNLETMIEPSGPFTRIFGYMDYGDEDTVAFWGVRDDGHGEGIYATDGTTLTTIADSTGVFGNFESTVSINSHGMVAFAADLACGGPRGVYIGDGDSIEMIADESGPFSYLLAPSINDQGDVAFTGFFNSNQDWGIFTGPDFENDRVLVNGDPLFDSEVLYVAPGTMNNAGQIAFFVTLADYRQVVGVATPVPEPATLGLLALGLAAVLRRHE